MDRKKSFNRRKTKIKMYSNLLISNFVYDYVDNVTLVLLQYPHDCAFLRIRILADTIFSKSVWQYDILEDLCTEILATHA